MCLSWFCFFKQKTAYEMRISDWRSDVCSSDLPPGHYRGLGHLHQAEDALLHPRAARCGDDDVAAMLVERFLRAAAERLAHRHAHRAGHEVEEIGRASCRDRGGQDV